MIITTPVVITPPFDGGGGDGGGGDDNPPVTPGQIGPLTWRWSAPWLGRAWTLTDLTSPVIKLRDATGVGRVDPEHWWSDAPTLDGSTWTGSRVGRGEVFLPLMVTGRDSGDFLVQSRAFMASLNPRQEGVLEVIRPDGERRSQRCRYQSGADLTLTLDPVASCRATYGITWATADPYWTGDPITLSYEFDPGDAFFPGPPFTLGKGLTLNNAKITNPGDVASFAVWRVYGPFTGFTVGLAGVTTAVSLTKSAGQWVEIDTTPGVKSIRDETGVNRFSAATVVDMSAQIPPGVDLPLSLTVTGAAVGSKVDLSFTPRYWAAW